MLRVTEWWQLEETFNLCAKFESSLRPTALSVFETINEPEASLFVKKLEVSQNTVLERADFNVALGLIDSFEQPNLLENDGTNACTFLAIKIGDAVLDAVSKVEINLSPENMAKLAEEVIISFPSKINSQRDSSKKYDPSEAKQILEANELLATKYDLSEECISANAVFSEAGRKELCDALTKKQQPGIKTQVGLYTCCPYTFLVGIHTSWYFLIDTHPICEVLGGDGNGILVRTKDLTSRSCMSIVQWILKRLKASGLNWNQVQSLAWMIPKLEIGTYLY